MKKAGMNEKRSTKFGLKTPVGRLAIEVEGETVIGVELSGRCQRAPGTVFEKEVARQFKEYFLGKRKEFSLPLMVQGSSFCQDVLKELWALDFGEVISYQDLALRVRKPKAARAVARIMARNRLPILLPCHRIVQSTGALGGYGGGSRMKKALLQHEHAL